jgi:hypothetical protein
MVTRAPCGSTFSILRSPLVRLLLLGAAALAFVLTVPVHAQDFDAYKVRLSGFWASLNSFRKPARIL